VKTDYWERPVGSGLGEIMTSREVMKVASFLRSAARRAMALGLLGMGLYTQAALAKDPSVMAIELYDGSAGPAYIQLGDVLINGKAGLKDCTPSGTSPIDKSVYSKFEKIMLNVGAVLERGADGVLRYSNVGGPAICVVPENVKFEHSASLSPASIAEQAQLIGRPIAPGTDGANMAQPMKRGVKLIFVPASNVELAEFLLAQRTSSIAKWRSYLGKYPASPHAEQAKSALAMLYVEAGEKALSAYEKSAATASPSYSDLKESKAQDDLARAVRSSLDSPAKLAAEIGRSLSALTDKGRAELDSYIKALAAGTPGYGHLQTARGLAEAITGIDPDFQPGTKLLNDVVQAKNAFESALASASAAIAAKQMDDALQVVIPFRAFAEEEPRIAQVIDAAYTYHYELGKQADLKQDWQTSVSEYQKAAKVKDTAEVDASLKEATQQLAIFQDNLAARTALESSNNFEAQKDFIDAYEVLFNLPASQRKIVADDIARLTPGYIQAASDKAKSITKNYPTIQGIGDERQVEQAYTLLQRTYPLIDEESTKAAYQTRMENLADELSAWFLERSKHYNEKPAGSGTEVGWAYLREAESYKAANLEQVRDQNKVAGPAHSMHSKISIRVHFVDQTSLRESTDFMHQLEDAIITGLEAPAFHATTVRYGETISGVEPDFQLEGNILEHEITEIPTAVSKDSKYRTGTHPEPNEAWNKANRAYEDARDQLQADQSSLTVAQTKNNKKEIIELSQTISNDHKLVSNAEAQRDALPQYLTKDDIRTYQYTLKTIDIKNKIKLQFRISRTQSGQLGDAVVVEKEDPKQYELVEDVKADDTEGVKLKETTPNIREMQTALENSARDALIEVVQAKVRELPGKIYEEAKAREQEEDLDDAGEAYLRYLSVTSNDKTPERLHAEQFLREQFNFSSFPSVAP
jgi:hypothetical protein